ncbi:MAG: alpha/beta hydrolase [Chitinophagales bacterium]
MKSWYMFFFQLPYIPEFVMNFNLKQFFIKAFRDWSYNKENFGDADIQKYVEAYEQEGAVTGGINYYRANISAVRKEKEHQNRKVKAPTLMIWGDGDKALGTELVKGTEKYIDNTFQLHRIKECSHWVQNDCPEEVNEVLLDFLS